jgi:hypothetical protein
VSTFNHSRRIPTIALAFALLLVQLPFVATGHVQEDAFITFRSARNLVETGVYGFNPGERVSASTSHAEVFVVAALRGVFGSWFLPAVQVTCGIATIAGIYLLASALVAADARRRDIVWAISGLVPVSILIAYSGMETGLLILALGAILAMAADARFRWTGVAAWFLIPWVRPDAIAFCLVVFVVSMAFSEGRTRIVGLYALAGVVGLLSWLAFNELYFGVWLPQTISGKAVVFLPDSMQSLIVDGLSRARRIFFGDGYDPGMFAPIESRYLRWLSVPAFAVTLAAGVSAVVQPVWAGVRRPTALILLLITFVMPLAYAAGGAPGTWYFWPSRLAGSMLIVAVVVAILARQTAPVRRFTMTAVASGLCILLVGHWCYAVAWGTQERLYRGGIGEEIRALSAPEDTLLLEPAGYVPYFAERWTWDEVGVATPSVTSHRRAYGSRWWIRFVQEKLPTFLLEREPMREFVTLDGYTLSDEERAWFERHYTLVRVFRYDPRSLRASTVLGRIASLGDAVPYFLYQRVSGSVDAMKTNQAAKVP